MEVCKLQRQVGVIKIVVIGQMETMAILMCLGILAILMGIAVTQTVLDLITTRVDKETKVVKTPDQVHKAQARKVQELQDQPTTDQVRIAAILVQAGLDLEQAMAQAKEILSKQGQNQKPKGKQI